MTGTSGGPTQGPQRVPPIQDWNRLLEGRVAVVTGGGVGIGGAIARLFAEHGAIVEIVEVDPDEVEFKDIEAFKDAILERPEKFMRAFSEHLLSYALGRELKITDKPSIDKITRRVMVDHGRFSTVVVEIAKSLPFRHKTGQTENK